MNRCQFFNRMVMEHCNGLPNDYQRVDWIENGGTGRCYIHAAPNVSLGVGYHVSIAFEFVNTIGGSLIGGDTDSSYPYPIYTANFTSKKIAYRGADFTIPTVSSGVRYTLDYYTYGNQFAGSLNGVSLTYSTATNSNNNQLCLFYSRYGGYCTPCKLYEVTIRDSYNGTIIYSLIPCYRKSDNKPGLYDIVNNNFCEGKFSGSNAGTYILGPDV